ncbi:hypothetical protein [Thalassotalea piscium]|uniref:Uncharacterized protein n=1 Tax=Thalassotalea piscium TaxID=1230533 RepID=A0A7X0NIH9_9GAMM|nr:hypothetical protein [Thalassotalea piscium]MBB6544107.1 hypothetical protein [Thalassotalea piscium]
MNTVISDWFTVAVMQENELLGEVLWGIVVDDSTFRFAKNDYVCSSKITKVFTSNQLIQTASDSIYQTIGKGRKAIIDSDDFELLRSGFSPLQIKLLNRELSVLH